MINGILNELHLTLIHKFPVKGAQMNRIAQLFKGSIVNKVILLVALILISVGGILAVNTISFYYVKDSLELIIDRDIGQVIENTKINNNFRNSIVLSDLLINTFTERENTFEEEKDRLIDEIKTDRSVFNRCFC